MKLVLNTCILGKPNNWWYGGVDSQHFFITFVDGHVKDVLAERFAAIEEIRQYIICDETGASGVSNPHGGVDSQHL
jgi:hypothetical protein